MADLPAVTRFARVAACCAYRCASDATWGDACGDTARAAPLPLGGCLVGVLHSVFVGDTPGLPQSAGLWPLEGGGGCALLGLLVVRYGTCASGRPVGQPTRDHVAAQQRTLVDSGKGYGISMTAHHNCR